MKILSALMAIYMLCLVVLPCRDNCESEAHDVVATIESSQDHHETNNDICSPFCFCSCCATSVIVQPAIDFQHHRHTSSPQFSQYFISAFSEVHPSIWQPPKLS